MRELRVVLPWFAVPFLMVACDGDRSDHAGDRVEDSTPADPDFPADLPIIPATPDDEADEVGTEPCAFDYAHPLCRLDVNGPGYLAVDLGQGLTGYLRTLRAHWLGGADGLGLDAYGDPLLVLGPDGAPTPARVPRSIPAHATSFIALVLNLDSNTRVDGTFQTQVTIFDSLGNAHQLDLTFTRQADGSWVWEAASPQGEVDGTDDTTPVVVAAGALTFDTDGNLVSNTQSAVTATFLGATAQDLVFSFGRVAGPGASSTSNAGVSAVSAVDQDGFAPGDLVSLGVGWRGDLRAQFSNGQEFPVGTLAVALFDAPDRLRRVAPHLYLETEASGPPVFGPALESSRGAVLGFTLIGP